MISRLMGVKLKKGQYLEALLRSPRTVFTTKDIAMLWGEKLTAAVRVRLSSYVRNGGLIRLHQGIYSKDENYDPFELATRIYTPSYVSFETVLTRSGINFQYYGNIFVASYVSRDIEVAGNRISFVKIKDYVLTNTTGVNIGGNVSIATAERAFLDRVYVSKDYYFDNLSGIDWDKVFEILPIYRNKKMVRKVQKYFKHYKTTV